MVCVGVGKIRGGGSGGGGEGDTSETRGGIVRCGRMSGEALYMLASFLLAYLLYILVTRGETVTDRERERNDNDTFIVDDVKILICNDVFTF